MPQISKKINALFDREKWKEARALIEKEMEKRGGESDHWLHTRLATTYYEERRYKKALQLSEKAHILAPNCPLVLWDYAGALDALGRSEEAIAIFMSLISRGPDKIAREECGEGLEWAVSLLTDCFYRLSVCLIHLHRPQPARKFFVWYAQLVAAGAHSIYTDSESEIIKHILDVLREHPGERPPRSPRKGLKDFGKQAERLMHAA